MPRFIKREGMMARARAVTLMFSVLLGLSSDFNFLRVSAQVEGGGWKPQIYTERLEPEIHDVLYSYTPPPGSFKKSSCSYTRSGNLQTFKLLDSTSNRLEVRLNNDYTSGSHQFQGDVRIVSPLNNECVMQIFGNTDGATVFMLRGFAEDGGSLKYYERTTLATDAYEKWVTVNIVHHKGQYIHAYINKELVGSWDESVDHPNYFKYGVYGTMRTSNAQVEWRNVQIFTK